MSASGKAIMDAESAGARWGSRARYFNSGNAFALEFSAVPSVQFTAERDRAFAADEPTGLIAMDLSETLNLPFPATTPLVLSRYARIKAGETLPLKLRASAQLWCVLKGHGQTDYDEETISWKAGDIIALPGGASVEHRSIDGDVVAWLVTDEPTLAYLELESSAAPHSSLQPVHYLAEDLAAELDNVYKHPDADKFAGYAVVLSHEGLEHTRNIHPTMTLALNSLPPGRAQRPHVHSAMALTLCLQGAGCYSMVDGERKDWSQHAVMVTPPGAPHSHHNDGSERMECLIVQDGAFYYHARTTGFAFAD